MKAELSKLGAPPRAYFQKIRMTEEEMQIDEGAANSQRLPLTERFEKIQGARPGPNNVKPAGSVQGGGSANGSNAGAAKRYNQ